MIEAAGDSWIKPRETLSEYSYVRGATHEVAIESDRVKKPAGLAASGTTKEVEGLRRFAGQRWDKADRLKKEERSFERTLETLLERARKAEKLADEIEAKLKNSCGRCSRYLSNFLYR